MHSVVTVCERQGCTQSKSQKVKLCEKCVAEGIQPAPAPAAASGEPEAPARKSSLSALKERAVDFKKSMTGKKDEEDWTPNKPTAITLYAQKLRPLLQQRGEQRAVWA